MITPKAKLTVLELVAPCGINCRVCMAHMRDRNACPGCRAEDTFKSRSCVHCKIKNCAKLAAGEFQYCFQCGDFPCERVAHLDKRYRAKYATSPIANLVYIKTNGVRRFVKHEDQNWACPACGTLLCMHRRQCTQCGFEWHA